MRANISSLERAVSTSIGTALLVAAWKERRGPLGAVCVSAGAALIARGLSGFCAVNAALGRGRRDDTREALGGARGIHVRASVTVQRPAADLYERWRRLDDLPLYLRHLSSVRTLENGQSRWTVRGPLGKPVSWDAEVITNDGSTIAWRSVEGSEVMSAGSVRFRETSRGTEILVHLQYSPPGGAAGRWLEALLGDDPASQIREDLHEFKRLMEAGSGDGRAGGPSPLFRMANHRA